MKRRFVLGCSLFAMTLSSGCASDPSPDAEIWQEPVAVKGPGEVAIQPKTEVQEKAQVVEETEPNARPWEPDSSMGSEVVDAELTFDGDSIKKGPEEGEDQISEAFNPNAGYEDDEALTGGNGMPAVHGAQDKKVHKKLWVSAKYVTVRTAPSADSTVAGTLKHGSMVSVLSDSAGWAQIGPSRFVRSKYLSTRK
jgi:hypothetical protein